MIFFNFEKCLLNVMLLSVNWEEMCQFNFCEKLSDFLQNFQTFKKLMSFWKIHI